MFDGGRRLKTTASGAMQGLRRCVAQLVDVVDDGESTGHGERARGWRWTRLRRAAAAVSPRASSERERERARERAGVSARSGRERECVPRRQVDEGNGEAAGSCVASMLCSPSSTCLPVLASASSSLAQEVGWAASWAGQVGSR
jgi:hypothetical protein